MTEQTASAAPGLELHRFEGSSCIASVTYEDRTRTLTIEFHGPRIVVYEDVPRRLFDAFLEAESKGKFFRRAIRGQFHGQALRRPRKETQ